MLGQRTLREIGEQPEAWAAAIDHFDQAAEETDRLFEETTPDEIVFTGCGSSYYLSLTVAAVFQQVTGLRSKAIPASEILQFPQSVFSEEARPLLVATSRSGTTTETLRALAAARTREIPTLALTCAARSQLARRAHLSLHSPRGRETSVVMTKSFSSLLLLGLLLAAQRAKSLTLRRELRRLPALGRRVVKAALALSRSIGADASRFVFLGAGPMHGIAWEAMLKMTEMAQRPAVAYHPLEFRHGPIAVAGPGTLVVLFETQAGRRMEAELVRDLRRHGASVMRLRDSGETATEADVDITLEAGVSDAARALLYLPFAQGLAYFRAVGAGLDPDRPQHLTSVVRL
jgi:glucosamine--fructose-6-phosphate aminotransferase (isomerizing)